MDFGSAIAYPTRDSEWIKKTLIGGVLSIVPIANFIPTGHMLAIADQVSRNDTQSMPEWNDLGAYFMKGLGVVAITIVYLLPMILLLGCGYGVTFGLLAASGGGDPDTIEGTLNVALVGVQCVAIVLGLLCSLLIPPALTEYVVAGRLGAAFNVGAVLAEFRQRVGQYVVLTVAIVVVSWVASLVGVMLCFVGVIFTMPYVNFVYGHLLGQMVAARRIQ
jgi:hypothetical protein